MTSQPVEQRLAEIGDRLRILPTQDFDDMAWLIAELRAVLAREAALREALREFGAHEPECGTDGLGAVTTDKCTCGLDAALGQEESQK